MKRITLCVGLLCLFALKGNTQVYTSQAVTGEGVRNELYGKGQYPVTFNEPNYTDSSFLLYPNPVSDILWLQIYSPISKIFRVSFFDKNAKRLSQREYTAEAGSQRIQIQLPADDSGVNFYIRIEESGSPFARTIRLARQY